MLGCNIPLGFALNAYKRPSNQEASCPSSPLASSSLLFCVCRELVCWKQLFNPRARCGCLGLLASRVVVVVGGGGCECDVVVEGMVRFCDLF
jgi:hypothetical protein